MCLNCCFVNYVVFKFVGWIHKLNLKNQQTKKKKNDIKYSFILVILKCYFYKAYIHYEQFKIKSRFSEVKNS